MSETLNRLWTIDELGTSAALALSVNYEGAPNGRVRDVPDRRTIRYYTTLGLLDRPAEMRGRTALYGRRHLLQLVAIKRLQARGLSLAELQAKLLGLPDATLEDLASLPADVDKPGESPPSAPPPQANRAEAFWSAAPAPMAEASEPTRAGDEDRRPLEADPHPRATASLLGVRLNDAVTLLLCPLRALENDDLEAIRVVAEPLLKLLEKRRLVGPRRERSPS
jgi:DNA-binding transcriptional MerR regulator